LLIKNFIVPVAFLFRHTLYSHLIWMFDWRDIDNTVMSPYPLIQYPWFQLSAVYCGQKKIF
jgi:hypothetical protein